MAKKFGKFMALLTVAGAAAAGAYFYFKNRDTEDSFEDDDEDIHDDLEEFLQNEAEQAEQKLGEREYVPIPLSEEAEGVSGEDKVIGDPSLTEDKEDAVIKGSSPDTQKVENVQFTELKDEG